MATTFLAALACGGGGEERDGDRTVEQRIEPERLPAASDGSARFPRSGLSLLLISIDTCRPDRFGCSGNGADFTPRIDALAAEGAWFERAVASAPITLPSHCTLLTSQFPYRHRVRNNGSYRLADEKITVAEWLRQEGYRTGAFVGAFPLDRRFGLDQGFDLYDDHFPPADMRKFEEIAERRADDVVEEAVRWLGEVGGDPFLLFVHFFDPHWPYEAPEPFASEHADNPYDGEIAFVDGEVGRLVDALDDLDLAGRTVVVLTGDHGESLGEHGEVTHGVFNYESTIRIPLLIRWPDRNTFEEAGLRRGVRPGSQVREVDIVPTALDLIGLPPLPDGEGESLVPLLADPASTLDLVNYAESYSSREDFGWSEVRSISTDRWKFVLLPEEELYDLVADPGENVNRASENREIVADLRARLEAMIEEDERREAETAAIELDPESRRRLEALGYVTDVGEAPDEASYADLSDPKDRIDFLARFFHGKVLAEGGQVAEGLEILHRLVAEEPQNPRLVSTLADAYLRNRDFITADSLYRRALRLLPNNLDIRYNYSNVLIRTGRGAEAIDLIQSILETDPRRQGGHARLGDAYLNNNDREKAAAEYQKELDLYPCSAVAYNGLGKLNQIEGQTNEALDYYRKAADCLGSYGEAYYNMANLYDTIGDVEKAVVYYRRAIDTNPDLLEAYYNFAIVAKRHGQRPVAGQLLNEAIRRNPGFGLGYYGIGNLFREEGRNEEAIGQYRIALDHGHRNADIYLNLGVAYAGLNDLNMAIQMWDEAIRLDPQSTSAKTAASNAKAARLHMGGFR